MSKIYDGFAMISNEQYAPYHYENGKIKLYLNEVPLPADKLFDVVCNNLKMEIGGHLLFHCPTPVNNTISFSKTDEAGKTQDIARCSVIREVDYFIENYESGCEFSKMTFSFTELERFVPSSEACEFSENLSKCVYDRRPKEIIRFNFSYKRKIIAFLIQVYAVTECSASCSSKTKTELVLTFDKTADIEFALTLYRIVECFFSFIFNHRNLDLNSVVLKGEKTIRVSTEKIVPFSQILTVIDKYKDEPERQEASKHSCLFDLFSPQLENLFKLCVNNKISMASIHSSSSSRNLIDLKQSLHITATFENYQRSYLPEISSAVTLEFYKDLNLFLQKYIKLNTGKKKSKAQNFLKSISPNISLKEKICKTYVGYENWSGLVNILGEQFDSKIEELAGIANTWRNELAHEKWEFEPDKRVISAIRLVEHINYCIVLRQAGYIDAEISAIVEKILANIE